MHSSPHLDRSDGDPSAHSSKPKYRPRRSAAARRQQQQRADTRMISKLLEGIISLDTHRGSQLSYIGKNLYEVVRKQLGQSQDSVQRDRSMMPVCRHFMHNCCSYGDACAFSHYDWYSISGQQHYFDGSNVWYDRNHHEYDNSDIRRDELLEQHLTEQSAQQNADDCTPQCGDDDIEQQLLEQNRVAQQPPEQNRVEQDRVERDTVDLLEHAPHGHVSQVLVGQQSVQLSSSDIVGHNGSHVDPAHDRHTVKIEETTTVDPIFTAQAGHDTLDEPDTAATPTHSCAFLVRSHRSRVLKRIGTGSFGQAIPRSDTSGKRLRHKQKWEPTSKSQVAQDLAAITAFRANATQRLTQKSHISRWQPNAAEITTAAIREAAQSLIGKFDIASTTLKEFRCAIEEHFGFTSGALSTRTGDLKAIIGELVQASQEKPCMKCPSRNSG